jgi:hypothetical protein
MTIDMPEGLHAYIACELLYRTELRLDHYMFCGDSLDVNDCPNIEAHKTYAAQCVERLIR